MKKTLCVLCLSFVVSTFFSKSAQSKDLMVNQNLNNASSPFLEDENINATEEKKNSVSQKLSDAEMVKLNTTKAGYGQGVRFDDKNRPFGALDFNAEFLKYNSFAIQNTEEKVICLTFDQGYENGYTSKILDVLKEKGVKATFFIVESYEKTNEDLIKRMISEGHVIGNHSCNHYSMPTLDINTCKKEISNLHDKIKTKYDYTMELFRPPMGEFSQQSLAVTQSCGYKTVMWSYAYADWDVKKQMAPTTALNKLKKSLHPGAIYLLHSVSATNAEVLGEFIDYALENKYEFSTPE